MKTSNKILSITGIVIVVIILVLVLGSRIFLNKYTDSFEAGNLILNIDRVTLTENASGTMNIQEMLNRK